jgi:hypothetical protein
LEKEKLFTLKKLVKDNINKSKSIYFTSKPGNYGVKFVGNNDKLYLFKVIKKGEENSVELYN